MKKNKKLCIIVLFLLYTTSDLQAIVFERRKSFKDDIFEYYFLVAPIERPGFGSLITIGSIVNNIPVPWIDDGRFNFIGGFGKGKGENEFEGEDIKSTIASN